MTFSFLCNYYLTHCIYFRLFLFNLQIDNVLNTLQLIRSKFTKCGSLSGGQRKRLSIALELLDNRQVLFLDEPTR